MQKAKFEAYSELLIAEAPIFALAIELAEGQNPLLHNREPGFPQFIFPGSSQKGEQFCTIEEVSEIG